MHRSSGPSVLPMIIGKQHDFSDADLQTSEPGLHSIKLSPSTDLVQFQDVKSSSDSVSEVRSVYSGLHILKL